ncbi:predicted protein [Arabidopsis lyrata subsp. lyrata]|uniref:Predicted protein n=1 Tax=Arabidopsis lyrata subsp. lyrata TaxID=81972 RepID=D7MM84_ARALL|nr:hypothetical protein ARALYDRAFT_359201 [Arabidopsis lyrata subsp. lyrata]EFH40746.1 predicted protein [Arabidopsis lyrata subsp. lyrata]
MTIDYEICSDPFDSRCVLATSMYPPGAEPKKAKRFLEKIRGKEIKKSQGFDVDFSMFRVLFDFYPSLLDESNATKKPETDREYFGRLAEEAIERLQQKRGSGYIYFITFVVKDPCDDDNQTKIFQAKVHNVLCREIAHCFCRPKPEQQVKYDEDFKNVVKKRRVQV